MGVGLSGCGRSAHPPGQRLLISWLWCGAALLQLEGEELIECEFDLKVPPRQFSNVAERDGFVYSWMMGHAGIDLETASGERGPPWTWPTFDARGCSPGNVRGRACDLDDD